LCLNIHNKMDCNTLLSDIEKYVKKMAYMFDSYNFKYQSPKLKTKTEELLEEDKKFLLQNNFYEEDNFIVTTNTKIIEEFLEYN